MEPYLLIDHLGCLDFQEIEPRQVHAGEHNILTMRCHGVPADEQRNPFPPDSLHLLVAQFSPDGGDVGYVSHAADCLQLEADYSAFKVTMREDIVPAVYRLILIFQPAEGFAQRGNVTFRSERFAIHVLA